MDPTNPYLSEMEGRFQRAHNNIHSRKRQTRCGIALPERNNSCASGMPARRAITVVYYCRDWIDDPGFPEGIQIWLLLLFPNLPSPFRQILLEWKNDEVAYVKLSPIALLYSYKYIAAVLRWRIWKNDLSYPQVLTEYYYLKESSHRQTLNVKRFHGL